MTTRITYTDPQLIDYSKEHLLYELQMFRWVGQNLPREKGFEQSAYLESFAIHFRNLVEFLYTEPAKARDDDVVAADYFDSTGRWNPGSLSKSLHDAKDRANKEVGHLTYKRKGATDPTKSWPVADLFREVQAVAQKFATGASRKKLHADVVRWLNADPKTVASLIVSASSSTSNVAVSTVSSGPPLGKNAGSTGSGGASRRQ